MGILDQYKKAIEAEGEDMSFPSNGVGMDENDREIYEATLKKMRNGDFSKSEIDEAISNSKKNMAELDETHNGGINEQSMRIQLTRVTDDELIEQGLLKSTPISDIKIIRAYCPKCGKEMISKSPALYNPFTMEKICKHECCGVTYNLDKTYPHIAYYDENGEEIIAYGL